MPADPALGIRVSPVPVSDLGIQTYWGKTFHAYQYYPGDQVTVSAHGPGAVPVKWKTWGCSARCVDGSDLSEESREIAGSQDASPSVTVTVPPPDLLGEWLPFVGAIRAIDVTTAPNMVGNGGFEDPAMGDDSWNLFDYTKVPGWYSPQQTIEIDSYGDAIAGRNYTELATDKPSTLVTTVPITQGARYRVTFDYSGRPGEGTDQNKMLVTLRFQGTYSSFYLSQDERGKGDREWHIWTGVFTADNLAAAVLQFSDAGSTADSLGMALDNVSVTKLG